MAELQGFSQMDYAGVARILKLDAALSEAVVAVKLQEINGATLLAIQPTNFASALSLSQSQQGDHLEAFLSALKEVAKNPNAGAQQQGIAAADAAGTAAVIATKRNQRSHPGTGAAAASVQRKVPALTKGLHAPRVSGLKRPAPVAPVLENVVVPPAPVPLSVTSPVTREGEAQLIQQLTDPPVPLEGKGSFATESREQCQKREKRRNKSTRGKSGGEDEVKNLQRMEQKKLQQQQQEIANLANGKTRLRAKLISWAASILALKNRFDVELRRQVVYRSKRALLSTTGFPEGAGVQNELPSLVRRLGSLDGLSVAFEWKPQNPEQISYLICSNKLTRPTVKLYFALVNGAFILTEEFLQEAKKQKVWPDPRHFQRPDFPSVEQREKTRWLLRSLRICIDGPYRPSGLSKHQLQALAIAAGGVIGDDASAAVRLLEDAEALRRRQARGLWDFQGEKRAKPIAISTKWLLDCIRLWQLLPRDQHVLSLSCSPPNNSGKRLKGGKREISIEKKEKTEGEPKIPPECMQEGGNRSTLSDGLKVQQPRVAGFEQIVENQTMRGRKPGTGIVSKKDAPQQEQVEKSEPSLVQSHVQPRGSPIAKDAGQQAIKKPPSGKRLRNEEMKLGGNASRKKKTHTSLEKEKHGTNVPPHATDVCPESVCEVPATSDEAVAVSLDTATTPGEQSHHASKLTVGIPELEAGCRDIDDRLGTLPAVGDWEPREDASSVGVMAAREASSASAAPDQAAENSPQRDCPAIISHTTAGGKSANLAGVHLDVAGLFEPDEAGSAVYNFDLQDQCSLGQKFEDIHRDGIANTQRDAVCHLDENIPSNNCQDRMGDL